LRKGSPINNEYIFKKTAGGSNIQPRQNVHTGKITLLGDNAIKITEGIKRPLLIKKIIGLKAGKLFMLTTSNRNKKPNPIALKTIYITFRPLLYDVSCCKIFMANIYHSFIFRILDVLKLQSKDNLKT